MDERILLAEVRQLNGRAHTAGVEGWSPSLSIAKSNGYDATRNADSSCALWQVRESEIRVVTPAESWRKPWRSVGGAPVGELCKPSLFVQRWIKNCLPGKSIQNRVIGEEIASYKHVRASRSASNSTLASSPQLIPRPGIVIP
jgi:hypothetical protein